MTLSLPPTLPLPAMVVGTVVSSVPVVVGEEYPNCVFFDDERSRSAQKASINTNTVLATTCENVA